MKKLAFLSMDNIDDFYVYDDLLIEPLAAQGWQVQTISWQAKNLDWSEFDAVIIRSPWDYQDDPDAFMQVLETVDQQTWLLNPIATVRWNINKSYLRDIDSSGVEIVPSVFADRFDPQHLVNAFNKFDTQELIIKPLVSANADDTYRIKLQEVAKQQQKLADIFTDKGHIIQPFVPAILDEGEFSLFYFANSFSHAIRKVPQKGDFRVQEEHGGQLLAIQPDNALLKAGELALKAIPAQTLYARLDFVRYQDKYLVMELELIEPSLYFNMSASSPEKFVNAFVQMQPVPAS